MHRITKRKSFLIAAVLSLVLLTASALLFVVTFAPSDADAEAAEPYTAKLLYDEKSVSTGTGTSLTYTVVGIDKNDEGNNAHKNNLKIEIPDEATVSGDTFPVYAIADNAFARHLNTDYTFKALDLSGAASLKTIGESAFSGCEDFTALDFSGTTNLTTISFAAFQGCSSFTGALTIPDTVTSIGNYAFDGCEGFTALTLPDNTSFKTIPYNAFFNCSGLANVLVIPSSVTTINNSAFAGCASLTGVTIPSSVTSIGNSAFDGCKRFSGKLTLPSSVTTIGNAAFQGCENLTGVLTIPDSVTSIGNYAFYSCKGLQTVYLPNNTTTYGSTGVFQYVSCPIVAPNASKYTTYKNNNTFPVSTKLTYQTTVTFNANGGTIGNSASVSQTKLFDFALDYENNEDTKIWAQNNSYNFPTAKKDDYALSGWNTASDGSGDAVSALTHVTADATYYAQYEPLKFNTMFDSNAYTITGFSTKYLNTLTGTDRNNITIKIPATYDDGVNGKYPVTAIGASAFKSSFDYYGYTFTALDLSEAVNLQTIGASAFESRYSLKGTLTLPDSVTTIGVKAFYGCTGFTGALTLPDSVTTIGNEAFYNCKGFNGKLTFPTNSEFTAIPQSAFWGCTGFTGSLTIPNSVTTIGNEAFYNCKGFNGKLTLPTNPEFTTISQRAFSGCTGFTGALKIPDSVTKIDGYAFFDCTGFQTVYLPSDATYASSFSVTCPIIAPSEDLYNAYKTSGHSLSGDSMYLTYEITVEFDGNIGTVTGTATQLKLFNRELNYEKNADTKIWEQNSEYKLPTAKRNDFIFTGWNTASDGSGSAVSAATVAVADAIYYAQLSPMFNSEYSADDGGYYTLTGFSKGYLESLTSTEQWNLAIKIPATFDDGEYGVKPVTAIGENAFYLLEYIGYPSYRDFRFTSLDFTNAANLKTIGNRAFFYCENFKGDLTIPASVTTIGDSAFENCTGFKGKLTLSDSVTTIGASAFMYCEGFTGSLTIPNSVQTIGEYAFYHCKGFNKTLTLPTNSEFTTISSSAFSGCEGFTGVLTIPDSVTKIGSGAFISCKGFTGALTIPDSVTSIGGSAFESCAGLQTVYLPNGATYGNVFSGVTCPIIAPNKTLYDTYKSDSSHTLYNNGYLTYELTVEFDGNGGTVMGTGTATQQKLFNRTLNYVKENGIWTKNTVYALPDANAAYGIFKGWNTVSNGSGAAVAATTVVTADATYYAQYEFLEFKTVFANDAYTITGFSDGHLASLSSEEKQNIAIVIPATYDDGTNGEHPVTAIGEEAFQKSNYSGYTFSSLELSGATNLHTIGQSAFDGCAGLKGTLTLPASLTAIDGGAFYGCMNLTGNLVIPDSVKTIGQNAFGGCKGFTGDLTLPALMTELGAMAFAGCSGFNGKLTLPNNEHFTKIPDSAFTACTGLGELTIPNSVTTIESFAFNGCKGLKGVLTIPDTVTEIKSCAFLGCTGLETVYLSSNATYEDGAFDYGNCPVVAKTAELYNTYKTSGNFDYANLTYEFSVTFDGNDGQVIGSDSPTKLFGYTLDYEKNADTKIWAQNTEYKLPTAGKNGYLFIGWNTAEDGQGDTVSAETVVTADAYYAQYELLQFSTRFGNGAYTITGFSTEYLNTLTGTDINNIAIKIPATYNDGVNGEYPVVAIGDSAFFADLNRNYTFTSLDFTDAANLKTIGTSAFEGCSGLKGELTIPNTVTTIGQGAFRLCSGFDGTLTLPNGPEFKTIPANAFESCSGLTGELTIPNSVTTIGHSAFYECGFTGCLTLPSGISSIGDCAFALCNALQTVYLPDNGNTMYGEAVFGNNDMGFVTCPIVAPRKALYDRYKSSTHALYGIDNLTYETTVTFNANEGTISASVSVSPTKLFGYTLDYEKNADTGIWAQNSEYKLPKAEKEGYLFIGWNTARNGKGNTVSAETVVTADATYYAQYELLKFNTTFENGAYTITGFSDRYLESMAYMYNVAIVIPATFDDGVNGEYPVIAIGDSAFSADYYADYYITFNALDFADDSNLKTIGEKAFHKFSALTNALTIPDSVTTIGQAAFEDCSGFTGLKLSSSLKSIGNHAFYGCKGFKGTLTIPNSVTTIGESVFAVCSGFTGALTIPDSVATIGQHAFAMCRGFSSLTLPSNPEFTEISSAAFSDCSGFTGVLTIPDTVTKIGGYAFSNTGFTGALIIPDTVTKIDSFAFYDCTDLQTIYLPSGATYGESYVFLNVNCPIIAPSEDLYNAYKAPEHNLSDVDKLTYELTVTFDANEGTVTSGNTSQRKLYNFSYKYEKDATTNIWTENSEYTLPIAAKENYAFSGWNTKQNGSGVSIGTVVAATYYAQYSGILVRLEITGTPQKTEYFAFDEFDPTGLTVTAVFQIGEKTLSAGEYTVSYTENRTSLRAGDTEVAISYTGGGVTKTETVSGITVEKRKPTINPSYDEDAKVFVGGSLPVLSSNQDTLGTIVWDTPIDLSRPATDKEFGWTWTPDDTDNYETVTGKVTFNVFAVELESITATFNQGSNKIYPTTSFDKLKQWLTVTGTNNDGSDAGALTEYTLSGTLTAGIPTITVTVNGTITDTFEVTVTATALVSIAVTTNPTKTAYKAFDDFDATGMVVTATFSHGLEIITNYSIVDGGNLLPGTETITLSYTYDGITETATVSVTVSKIRLDMSGVTFADVTVKEDGSAHSLEAEGLPDGVTVTYTGTNGYTTDGVSAAGIYTVTATFAVEDTDNYEIPEAQTATLTVNRAQVVETKTEGETEKEIVVVESENGISPNITLSAEDVTETPHGVTVSEKDKEVKQVYDISLLKDGAPVQPSEEITIRLLIAENLRGESNLKVYHIGADGSAADVNAVRDGDYMVFSVSGLSKFAIVGDAEVSAGAIAATIIFWALAILCGAYILYYFNKKRKGGNGGDGEKTQTVKTYSFAPVLLAAVFVPAGLTAALVSGIIAFLGSAGYIVFLHCKDGSLQKLFGANKEKSAAAASDDIRDVQTENDCAAAEIPADGDSVPKAEEYEEVSSASAATEEHDESGGAQAANVTADKTPSVARFGGVSYRRSFLAKIIQGTEDNKRYYSALKNELLSYKKARSSVSFTSDTIYFGRVRLAKIVVAGKTLKIYLALDPEAVEKKYGARNAGGKKKYEKTPCCLRVKSDLGLKRAIVLVGRLMSEAGAAKIPDFLPTDYAALYPYEETESLVARGLIKKLVALGGDENVKADVSAFIRGKITVAEAQSALSDEAAATLVETVRERNAEARAAGKKVIVNIDTLSECFDANAVVTLDALKEKGLVPQNADFVKILARGALDKPLTVEANDFSLDAVRMITLTGGKAIKFV